jgi:hypothetical protein
MFHGARTMTEEADRTRLIGDIARVLRAGPVPDDARAAALVFIGWLARRMPGEAPSSAGVSEVTARLRAAGARLRAPGRGGR